MKYVNGRLTGLVHIEGRVGPSNGQDVLEKNKKFLRLRGYEFLTTQVVTYSLYRLRYPGSRF